MRRCLSALPGLLFVACAAGCGDAVEVATAESRDAGDDGVANLTDTDAVEPGAAAPPALAERGEAPRPTGPLGADRRYVVTAAGEETSATELNKFAFARASDGAVRQYAQALTESHAALQRQLRELVQRRGAIIPTAMSSSGQKRMHVLARHRGSHFDREFLALQIFAQRDTRRGLERMAQDVRDGEVRVWAAAAVSLWRHDEDWARSIHQELLSRRNADDHRDNGPFGN